MTREEKITIIKQCGQSIIDNADSIAGKYEHQTDLDITIRLPMDEKVPTITVYSEFVPEGVIQKGQGGGGSETRNNIKV